MAAKILEKIILEMLKAQIKSRADLDSFKRKMAKKYKISCPNNVALLKIYHELVENKTPHQNKFGTGQGIRYSPRLEELLRTRPVRSLSGIVNVSVLTKPYPCPGECIYCPTQKGIPKSYLRGEPAVERAVLLKFDPYRQVQTRLMSLEKTGHPIDKIELRIIGGTWSYYPKNYQTWFVKECFRACNEFSSQKQIRNNVAMAKLTRIRETRLKEELIKQQKRNEKTKCRIVGITVETRPDYVDVKEVKRMRELGITRVELGVQSIYNDVLKLNRRGHNVSSTIKATRLLKDAGFKVSYQMMPNLPGSDFERDIKMFEEIFKNPDFRPDLLKIYPLALVRQSPLYRWYLKGKFKPYSKRQLINLLIEIKKRVPRYCRIQRIVRDIPSKDIIEGGSKILNLREVVQKEMGKREASGGEEIFLSFENRKREKLYALLRLRLPSFVFKLTRSSSPPAFPALEGAAIIREVHTYGQMLSIGEKSFAVYPVAKRSFCFGVQHRGLGKKLIREAKKIAKREFGLNKITVISAVGTRPYYRKFGYRLEDTYMIKKI